MNALDLAPQSSTVIRMVTFAIADRVLALPLSAVLKVVNCPPQLLASLDRTQLVHFGQNTLTVFNLHPPSHSKQLQTATRGQFLVIISLPNQELCGIRVDTPPDLIDVPTALIRPIPESYRRGRSLRIVSQVAMLPQAETTLSIFLLDMEQVVTLLKTDPEDYSEDYSQDTKQVRP